MRVQLLTLRFAPALGAFDDRPLTEALRGKHVLEVREHFFCVHEIPHLACLIAYDDAAPAPPAPATTGGRAPTRGRGRGDPFTEVSEEERALCQRLRQWRAERARKDGLPPYLVLTNQEIVAVVRARPTSLAALEALEGLGPGRVKRYGGAILSHLEACAAPVTAPGPAAPAAEPAP